MDKNYDEKYHEILNSGELYDCTDSELFEYQHTLVEKMNEYNRVPDTKEGRERRTQILKEILGTYSEGVYIEPPVHSNWGLHHVHLGKNVYMNSNCDLVDDADITIKDNVMFGPNVTIVTAAHPISPSLRRYQIEYNKPVVIEENVWIGACVTILPGVHIGENSVIGAGSLVTHDIPANVVAYGSPAKVIRDITKEDEITYDHGKPIPQELLEKYK